MTIPSHHPIRNGMEFHDGKLYQFSKGGIIVASRWPDMRAWRKTPKGSRWMQIRPLLKLGKTSDGWAFDFAQREPRLRDPGSGASIHLRIGQRPPEEEFAGIDGIWEGFPGEALKDANSEKQNDWWEKVERRRSLAQAEYLDPVPQEVLEAVFAFPCRHWHLLNLAARCPGALDLIGSNPGLAFCLASLWAFREPAPCRPLRSARALIRKPQAEIAAWLGFPRTRSAVRVIRKLEAKDCTIPHLLSLRRLFSTHGKALRHLPRINGEILRLMAWEGDHCRFSIRFLAEMISSESPLGISDTACVRDVLWMRQHLGETGTLLVRSREHLAKVHDRYVIRMGRADLSVSGLTPFPDPPLPPTGRFLEMTPLRNERELAVEARMQRNCVGAYGPRVRAGRLFVYRIDSPERATLSIALARSGRWQLSEIRTCDNRPVGVETLEAVQSWIEEVWRAADTGTNEPF